MENLEFQGIFNQLNDFFENFNNNIKKIGFKELKSISTDIINSANLAIGKLTDVHNKFKEGFININEYNIIFSENIELYDELIENLNKLIPILNNYENYYKKSFGKQLSDLSKEKLKLFKEYVEAQILQYNILKQHYELFNKNKEIAEELSEELSKSFISITEKINSFLYSIPIFGSSLSKILNIDNIKDQIKEKIFNEIIKNGKISSTVLSSTFVDSINIIKNKLTELFAFIKQNILAISGVITAFIIYKSIQYFNELRNQLSEFRKETGLFIGQVENILSFEKISELEAQFRQLGITNKEIIESTSLLFDKFKSISFITEEMKKAMLMFQSNLGLSSDEAASLIYQFEMLYGKSIDYQKTLENISNIATKYGLSAKKINQEFIKNYDKINTLLSKQSQKILPEIIAKMQKMGVELSTILDISENMLSDFEGSIEKELELSLYIGRHINFAGMRMAAFTGNIELMWKEVDNIISSIDEKLLNTPFMLMKISQALGISSVQLKEYIERQKRIREMSWVDKKKMEEIDKIQKTVIGDIDKLKGQLASLGISIYNILSPIYEILMDIIPLLIKITEYISNIMTKIRQFLKSIGTESKILNAFISLIFISTLTGLSSYLIKFAFLLLKYLFVLPSKLFGKLFGGISILFEKLKDILGISKKVSDGISTISKSTEKLKSIPTKDGIFNSINKFIKEFKIKNAIAIAISLIALAGAIYILSKAMKEIASIDLGAVIYSLSSIIILTYTLSNALKFLSNFQNLKGILAFSLLAGIIFLLSKSLSELGKSNKYLLETILPLTILIGIISVITILLGQFSKQAIIGAIALVLISGAIYILSKAITELTKFNKDLLSTLLVFTIFIALISAITLGLGALNVVGVIGAAVLLGIASAIYILSKASINFANAIKSISNIIINFLKNLYQNLYLISTLSAGQLISIAGAITAIGASLVAFSATLMISGVIDKLKTIFLGKDNIIDKIINLAKLNNEILNTANNIEILKKSLSSFISLRASQDFIKQIDLIINKITELNEKINNIYYKSAAKISNNINSLSVLESIINKAKEAINYITFESKVESDKTKEINIETSYIALSNLSDKNISSYSINNNRNLIQNQNISNIINGFDNMNNNIKEIVNRLDSIEKIIKNTNLKFSFNVDGKELGQVIAKNTNKF